jgi:hypothetical protein
MNIKISKSPGGILDLWAPLTIIKVPRRYSCIDIASIPRRLKNSN